MRQLQSRLARAQQRLTSRSVLAGVLATSIFSPLPASGQFQQSQTPELVCAEKIEMGTPFKICVYANPSERMSVDFDLAKAFRQLKRINDWMSEWQPGTQLSQVNQAAGARPVKVGDELFDLMTFTLNVSANTDGAFDPTFNAFWGLYNFKPGQSREPTEAEIKERLPLVDWRNVILDPREKSIFLKQAGMKLGLGGLGQGYGVDAVVGELKRHYPAGYVDGSGDTYFWGKKPDGSLWITGVRDPHDKQGSLLRIYGTDFAITTSGDDEKFFMVGDRRVHHIIDPKTGRPASRARQVTVVARRALDADAYDTSAFVLGSEKGKALLERLGLRGVLVTDKSVTLTKGFKKTTTKWGEVYEIEGTLNELNHSGFAKK